MYTRFLDMVPEYVAAKTAEHTSAYQAAAPSDPTLVIGIVYTLLTYPSALQLSPNPPLPAAQTYTTPFLFRPYICKETYDYITVYIHIHYRGIILI